MNPFFFKKLTLILFIFFTILFVSSNSFGAEDLLTLYKRAVETDPLLKKALSDLEASKAQKPLARSLLLPKLEAGMGQGYYNKNITGIRPDEIQKGYWGDNYSARLIQPIFDGQAWVSLKMAKSMVGISEAQVLFAKQDLIKRVAMAYFDLLDAKALLRAQKERVKLDKKILDRARVALRAGTGDIVSLKEAKARFDASRARLVSFKNLVEIKRENLSITCHSPIGDIKDVRSFKVIGPEPNDVNQWIMVALDNQPILHKAQKELELSREKLEHEKRARWPRIDLEAQADYANGLFLPDVIYREAHTVFKFTFPLYLGGSIEARTDIAQSKLISSRHKLEHLKDVITLKTKQAFLRLRDSIAIVNASKEAMESARVSMDATTKGYEIGTRNVIDALDMTDKYILNKMKYNRAIYDHLKARVMLKTAAGIITERDITSLNGLLE